MKQEVNRDFKLFYAWAVHTMALHILQKVMGKGYARNTTKVQFKWTQSKKTRYYL